MNEVLSPLITLDQELFLRLNGWHNPFWDSVMQVITYKFTWIPLYLLLMYGIVAEFKRKAVGYLLCTIAIVALSDQVASGLFKPYFMRPRPCHDPMIQSLMHLVGKCGGAYGFVSSHAATGFGIATGINLLPTRTLPGVRWLFGWALVYAYSRVYVGVHYPFDILVGGLIGLLVAFVLVGMYRYFARRSSLEFM